MNLLNNQGYTLVELIVILGILALLTTGGFATLVSFRERREVLSSARAVATSLRSVQVKSSAVEVPSGCALKGVARFDVSYSDNSNQVNLEAFDSLGSSCWAKHTLLTLIGNSKFVGAQTLSFRAPNGSSDSAVVSICAYGIQYDLTITESGSVSEPEKSATPGC